MSVDEREDDEPFCYTCISSAWWEECESCGGEGEWEDEDWDGWIDWVPCDICRGKGGWWVCLGTERHNLDPASVHRIPLEEREVTA